VIRAATPDAIAAAADLLRRGNLVAFPTETVYGLGADATDASAVAHIFAVKRRPAFDPLIVHIDSVDDLSGITRALSSAARELTTRFWPGPLTVVLPKTDRIPDIVTAGLPSVAVRVPDHAVARALIAAAGCPIAAPSANPFGYISPTTAAHVGAQLGTEIPLILDGGPCRVGIESTIVSFLGREPALLRAGGISLEDIAGVIGPVRIETDAVSPLAPGQSPRHYAPHTPITIVAALSAIPPAERATAALLLPRPAADADGFAQIEVLSNDEALTSMAAGLFAAMRRLDAGGYRRIFALAVPEAGLGRAIMDRLRRAGAPVPR
jgi:L-threonylcarbamoyladenylate synthase